MFTLLLFCCLFRLEIFIAIINNIKQRVCSYFFTWHSFCVLQYWAVAYKCNVMCFTAARNILRVAGSFCWLSLLKRIIPCPWTTPSWVTCCHFGITVIKMHVCISLRWTHSHICRIFPQFCSFINKSGNCIFSADTKKITRLCFRYNETTSLSHNSATRFASVNRVFCCVWLMEPEIRMSCVSSQASRSLFSHRFCVSSLPVPTAAL